MGLYSRICRLVFCAEQVAKCVDLGEPFLSRISGITIGDLMLAGIIRK